MKIILQFFKHVRVVNKAKIFNRERIDVILFMYEPQYICTSVNCRVAILLSITAAKHHTYIQTGVVIEIILCYGKNLR